MRSLDKQWFWWCLRCHCGGCGVCGVTVGGYGVISVSFVHFLEIQSLLAIFLTALLRLANPCRQWLSTKPLKNTKFRHFLINPAVNSSRFDCFDCLSHVEMIKKTAIWEPLSAKTVNFRENQENTRFRCFDEF